MNNKKITWNKPSIYSLNTIEVKANIVVSACSRYSGCWPGAAHIVSIPGKPPVSM